MTQIAASAATSPGNDRVWLVVARGLTVGRAGYICLFATASCVFAAWLAEQAIRLAMPEGSLALAAWIQWGAVWLAPLPCLIGLGCIVLGDVRCCAAPRVSGAKTAIVLTLVLKLIGLPLIAVGMILEVNWFADQFYDSFGDNEALREAVLFRLPLWVKRAGMLTVALALLCHVRFLWTLAGYLGDGRLARSGRRLLLYTLLCGTGLTAYAVLVYVIAGSENDERTLWVFLGLMAPWLLVALSLTILFCNWLLRLMKKLRTTIVEHGGNGKSPVQAGHL